MSKSEEKKHDGFVNPGTMERRTVLEWFGKAAVLGLSSPLLTACLEGGPYPDDNHNGETTSSDDDGTDSTSIGDSSVNEDTSSPKLVFEPGEGHPLLDQFVVFTVDEQNLSDILKSWTLTIDGLVENPVTLTFRDLLDMTPRHQTTDFHCVTGWSVLDVPWVGVHLSALLQRVVPQQTATHITFHCTGDIYTESTTLEEALEPNSILAYGVGDSTLPLDHGFPLRLIVPRKLGYKNAKYLYRVELTDAPLWGYWEQRGYPYEADVPESRLREGKY